MSTPVTIICGLHQATRFGLLVKGGEFLEIAGKLRCVAFDKTGTLTEGRPVVAEIRTMPGVTEDEVVRIAAALEAASEHPLGEAIVSFARNRGLVPGDARNVTTIRGAGIVGEINGHRCFVGSIAHVRTVSKLERLPAELDTGAAAMTVAVVGRNQQVLGAIYLADRARSDAMTTIAELRRLKIECIVMLTGDSRATAGRIASELGIDKVHAELLPQDKVSVVKQHVSEHYPVAMLGDGVNDAPALAAANLGIALGTQASHTALETADVVSLSPHLRRLPELIQLGRSTRRILAQNITLALTIKLVVLLLAAIGLGTLWAAVVADVGASMLVIVNGMRLLRPVDVGSSLPTTPAT
jgi:Cd2+/Zn2+-exporting ATPase